MNARKFVTQSGGVVGTVALAQVFEVPERVVRQWAIENDAPKLGPAFAFTPDLAVDFEASLDDDDDDVDADDADDGSGDDADDSDDSDDDDDTEDDDDDTEEDDEDDEDDDS